MAQTRTRSGVARVCPGCRLHSNRQPARGAGAQHRAAQRHPAASTAPASPFPVHIHSEDTDTRDGLSKPAGPPGTLPARRAHPRSRGGTGGGDPAHLVGVPQAHGAAQGQLPHQQVVHPAEGELQVPHLVLLQVPVHLLCRTHTGQAVRRAARAGPSEPPTRTPPCPREPRPHRSDSQDRARGRAEWPATWRHRQRPFCCPRQAHQTLARVQGSGGGEMGSPAPPPHPSRHLLLPGPGGGGRAAGPWARCLWVLGRWHGEVGWAPERGRALPPHSPPTVSYGDEGASPRCTALAAPSRRPCSPVPSLPREWGASRQKGFRAAEPWRGHCRKQRGH